MSQRKMKRIIEEATLREKIREYKNKGLDNADIALNLAEEKNADIIKIMEKIKDEEWRENAAKEIHEILKKEEIEYSRNEYGIPMIDKDGDW